MSHEPTVGPTDVDDKYLRTLHHSIMHFILANDVGGHAFAGRRVRKYQM